MSFWLLALTLSVAFAAVAVWAHRTGGNRRLWLASLVTSLIVLGLGVVDWRGQSSVETPLHTYILLAVVPTAAIALLVRSTVAGRIHPVLRIVLGGVAGLALSAALAFTVFFP